VVAGLARWLEVERGIGKGDRVAIGMRNYPEWVVAFGAITSVGAISVSLNAWWTEDELEYALADSGSTVLLADTERVERTRSARCPSASTRGGPRTSSTTRWRTPAPRS